jgi:hypothetical protein
MPFKIYLITYLLALLSTGCIHYKQMHSTSPIIHYDTENICFKPYEEDSGYQINIPACYVDFRYNKANRILGYNFFYQTPTYDTVSCGKNCTEIILSHKEIEIYIATACSPNWKNLAKSERAYNRFVNHVSTGVDTFEYSGKKNNRYWKDICITTKGYNIHRGKYEVKDIIVGYMNVPLQYKALFDSCLYTLQPLQNSTIKIDNISKKIDSLEQINNYEYRR